MSTDTSPSRGDAEQQGARGGSWHKPLPPQHYTQTQVRPLGKNAKASVPLGCQQLSISPKGCFGRRVEVTKPHKLCGKAVGNHCLLETAKDANCVSPEAGHPSVNSPKDGHTHTRHHCGLLLSDSTSYASAISLNLCSAYSLLSGFLSGCHFSAAFLYLHRGAVMGTQQPLGPHLSMHPSEHAPASLWAGAPQARFTQHPTASNNEQELPGPVVPPEKSTCFHIQIHIYIYRHTHIYLFMHTYTNTHKLNKQNRNNLRTTAQPQQCNVCPPQLLSLMALDNVHRFVLEPSWALECAWTRGC